MAQSPLKAPLNLPSALLDAIHHEGLARYQRFLKGIKAYQNHPYQRQIKPLPVVFQESTSRLFLCQATQPQGMIVIVPSLINRSYILDLAENNSFIRKLGEQGYTTLLVDWGDPTVLEQPLGLDGYMGRLLRMVEAAKLQAGDQPVYIMGYCMGGLLAMAAAVLKPKFFKGLCLLATPWDFHVAPMPLAQALSRHWPSWQSLLPSLSVVPVEGLQWYFSALNPLQILQKFSKFADLPPQSAAAQQFVALEDWLNDGVAVTQRVIQESLENWYRDNLPIQAQWRLCGQIIDPRYVDCPILAVLPKQDRIVPPASASAISSNLPSIKMLTIDAGHIGMVASPRAAPQTIAAIVNWLNILS